MTTGRLSLLRRVSLSAFFSSFCENAAEPSRAIANRLLGATMHADAARVRHTQREPPPSLSASAAEHAAVRCQTWGEETKNKINKQINICLRCTREKERIGRGRSRRRRHPLGSRRPQRPRADATHGSGASHRYTVNALRSQH